MRLLERKKKTSSFGFAFFFFGLTLMTMLFHAYNYPYYNLEQGIIDITWASIAKVVFVITDWVNDILFGYLSEKTKSKWGKRLPWLVYGSIFIPLFVLLTYSISKYTGFSPSGIAWYYIIISVCFENASTVMYTNYNALFPTLFTSTNERAKTSAFIHIFEALAMAVCFIATPLLREKIFIADNGTDYLKIGIIYMAVYYISLIVMICSTRFSDDVKAEQNDKAKYSIRSTLKDAFSDKSFVFFHLAQSCYKAIMAIISALYAMYFTYCLKNISGTQQSILFACAFASLFLFIPIWRLLLKRFSAVTLWQVAYAVMPFFLLLLLIPNNFITGVIVFSIICAGDGVFLISPDIINATIIDMDRLKHHVSREASLGSVGNLIEGISVIISSLVTIVFTSLTGYKSGTNPGPNPEMTFRLVFGEMLPIIGLCGGLFAQIYVKVSKTDRLVLHALKRKSLDDTTEVSITEVLDEIRK